MKWAVANWFKISIVALLLIAISLAAYYFMVFIPQNEAVQERKANAEKAVQSVLLQGCLSAAQQDYSENWASNCATSGISDRGPNCSLSLTLANSLNEDLQNAKDECFKEYPQS